jgi:beta-galactosidase
VASDTSISPTPISRRALLGGGLLAAGSAAWRTAAARAATARQRRPAGRRWRQPAFATATYNLNQGWLFGGIYRPGAQYPGFREQGWTRVTLPHTVTRLSWGDWSPASWEQLWIYHRHFSGRQLRAGRTFVDFDGVLTDATVYLNGLELGTHRGGYLPFSVELTQALAPDDNLLAVVVDGRWLDVPPQGFPQGPTTVDFLQPAGIYRDVRLRNVPEVFISDVFAKPIDVLSARPTLEVLAAIDASAPPGRQVHLTAELLDRGRRVARESVAIHPHRGLQVARLSLERLRGISLWAPHNPRLYTLKVTLSGSEIPSHTVTITTGFREARFELDGLYLNGERTQIFGLDRHQLFPYTGMAAPARLQRRDAELIRMQLNCNMVRCSHYPQSPHFLDACDQLGLMVWEEAPGWHTLGGAPFEQAFLENVRDMVLRDRNRPSVIVWGTRLDETYDYPTLYAQARSLAYQLDGTRQTTGAMSTQSTIGWAEDVFAYNDYSTVDGQATLKPPLTYVPYMVSEAVGTLVGAPFYRWIDPSQTLQLQAQLHAAVHDLAATNQHYAGLLAWCAIDYASLLAGDRTWHAIKWPGVLDTFRVPKPGASIYRSQQDPSTAPLILPAFFWDFGPGSPPNGPGPNALIATNCERLELYLDGQPFATATPDRSNYGNLPYPPAFVDLTVANGSALPQLRIDGYVSGRPVTSLTMVSNPATDRLVLTLEDRSIVGDGSDATRVTFRALDPYGNQRPHVTGQVSLRLDGPAELICQNPFAFETYGGVGGGFIRSFPGAHGTVTLTASHPTLGRASARLLVTPARLATLL